MNKFGNAIKAEFVNLFGDFKSYYLNYIFYNINMYLLFLGLFYGMEKQSKESIEILYFLIGLILWWYTTTAIQSVSIIIQDEARQGTLEQIFMTKSKVGQITLCKLIANYLFETLQIIFVILLCTLSFGLADLFKLNISYINLLINILMTLVGLCGIGYAVAGLSIIYKKAQAVARATSNVILFFSGLILPITAVPNIFRYIAKVFPFYWSMESINQSIYNSKTILDLFNRSFGMLTLVSLIWVGVGILTFNHSIKIVKVKGSISHY